MDSKFPLSSVLTASSLRDLILANGDCTIGLTSVSLEGSADFTNSYTLATLAAWVRRVRPNANLLYASEVDDLVKCDQVWCTATSEAWNEVTKLGQEVVEAGKLFLVGGHHVTALPETLKYGRAFIGPAEIYAHIDELPLPDWSLFSGIGKLPVMMTGRGCPYSCNFCSSRHFWKKYRARGPESVIAEIKLLRDSGASHIAIFDDLFIASKRRLRRIVEETKAEGLDEVKYSCLVRSNLIDEETIRLLRDMNVRDVAFGSESGSDRILGLMNKHATVEDNQRAIDLLYDNGYRPTTSLIIGYPDETKEDLQLTVDFITRNREKCNMMEVYPCIPFPGTPVWDRFVREHNIDVHAFDWESLNVRAQGKDWDKYLLMTRNYDKERLVDRFIFLLDHALNSANVTVEVERHAVTVRLNSCESHARRLKRYENSAR